MKTASLLKQVRQKGLEIKLSGENLELIFLQDDVDDSTIQLVKENKEDIISYLKTITTVSSPKKIPLATKKEIYSMTSSQIRFWILCQMDEVNSAYNLPLILKLEGNLDANILQLAYNELVERHEVLRTHFVVQENGIIAQKILEDFDFQIKIKNISKSEEVSDVINEFIKTPFELKESILFKTMLIQESKNEHYLCINIHHIISDGSSLEVLLTDLTQIYNSIQSKKQLSIPELKIQFKDYAEWVSDKDNVKGEEKYWLDKFSGEIPVINLPTYQPRPALKTYNGDTHNHVISKENLEKLRLFSSENRGTLFMSLMAAMNGVLYRYTSQTDIVLGTPVSGRYQSELQNQIGLYISTLPIRMQFDENISFYKLFKQQQQELESTYSNANYPFGDLVDNLNLSRDVSRSPLFDILISHHQKNNDSFDLTSSFDGLKCSFYDNFENKVSKYDLTFTFFEEADSLSISIEYNTDLFKKNFIESFAVNYENFIEQSIENPELEIKNTQYLDRAQIYEILNTFNATEYKYNIEETVISSFQKQATKSPEDIALACKECQISYKELDQRSTNLALYLQKQGVSPNTTVGVCLGRSVEMIIAILGILKSGASYLPLDPFYPLERLDYIINHSQTKIVLTDKGTENIIPKTTKTVIVKELEAEMSSEVQLPKINSSSLAYVIYTSGSTGKPKGVKVSHRNLTNFMQGMSRKFIQSNQNDVWLAMTSISFDISILELLWTLTRGDKVVIHLERPIPIQPKPSMDFSLFYFPTGTSSEVNKYKLLKEGATFADKNGFEAIWVPERHFHDFGDQFPNPSIAAAAASSITQNIKLRSGSVVLPLHDTVRVAEEWSMVDNLSNGRVELSIASGWHPNDFVLAPNSYENRHQLMREQIDELKSLWAGNSVKRKNGIGKDFEFTIHPKPIQDNLTMWITAAGSIETFKYAGSIGANLLTHLLGQSIEDLAEKIKVYKDTLRENGFDPEKSKVALMLHTFVSDNEAMVKKVVEIPFKNYLKNSLNLLKPMAEEQGLDLDKDQDILLDIGFLRFYKTSSLFGTPESCLEIIDRAHNAGVDEIACLIDFGVEEQLVIENLDHLNKLKELIRRSKVQYDFIVGKVEGLTVNENTETLIKKHQVTHIQSTPSFYEEFLSNINDKEVLNGLKTLLVGGEALKKSLADKLVKEVSCSIYNMYGPTETTIWSSVKAIETSDDITIGKPIVNTGIYILDTYNQLCPVGVSGELCIGGDGVSLGYMNNDTFTASKFIENPFKPKEKLYKTGDLACWLPNGDIEYQGRLDSQVKIKGHRIELEEIENVILEYDVVEQCAVSTFLDNEQTVLAAYIKVEESVEEETIKGFLRLRLPNYMIPQHIITLKEFPQTANGKIDVKKLPLPNAEKVKTKKYVAPRNEMEEKLVTIWSDFLKIEQISMDDNFFEIGGNSMKVFQLLSIINSSLNTDLKIISFFQYPTIETLAENLDKAKSIQKIMIEENEMEDVEGVIDFMNDL